MKKVDHKNRKDGHKRAFDSVGSFLAIFAVDLWF
jgi:hypothetical protein